jgi:hypothetical protein
MPSKEYIITVIGGTWNGTKLTKFSLKEAEDVIEMLESYFDLECELEIRELI